MQINKQFSLMQMAYFTKDNKFNKFNLTNSIVANVKLIIKKLTIVISNSDCIGKKIPTDF
jgi:hypothetical protein